MSAPNLGSILLGTSNVDEMKDWYRRCFAPEVNDMGALIFGACPLFIEAHDEVSGPTENPHRVILNLDVEDCRALEAHLRGQNVTWEREVEQMPFGLIGTVADPDGNLVQIIQWGATPDAGHGG
jgi:hypothetical protein